MNAPIKITFDEPDFSRRMMDFADVAVLTVAEAFRIQIRLYCRELIDRTPPFSGKAIRRMVAAREGAKFTDTEIEDATALAVGKRRVEKDIRKVIYGLEGAQLSARHMAVSKGANPNASDWGTLQRCEGKQAVRVFATKTGTVCGADLSQWLPNASVAELRAHHRQNRGKRGRVTMTGQKTRDVGRWRWLNVLVVPEKILKQFISQAQRMVGQGKGGWASGFITLGGRMSRSGWVGRHASAGTCEYRSGFAGGKISVTVTNNSAWASGGDPERIMEAASAGRVRAMEADIKRRIEKRWHTGDDGEKGGD